MAMRFKWIVLALCTVFQCLLHRNMLMDYEVSSDAFVVMQAYVGADVLRNIHGFVLFVFPVLFLVLASVDGVSALHDNRLLVMTRMSSRKQYAIEEQKILLKDAAIVVVLHSLATYAYCLEGRQMALSWMTVGAIVRNMLAVVLFGELYCFLMKAMQQEGAMAVVFATVILTAIAGLLEVTMFFRAGISLWTAVLKVEDIVFFHPLLLAGHAFLACAFAVVEAGWTVRKEF